MRADVAFYEKMTGLTYDIDKTVTFHCDFEEDFLGIDQLLDAEINSLKSQSNLESTRDILMEEHPDWSTEEITKALGEIAKARATKFSSSQPPKQITKSTDKSGLQQSSNASVS